MKVVLDRFISDGPRNSRDHEDMVASQEIILGCFDSCIVCILKAFNVLSNIPNYFALSTVPGRSARTIPDFRTWESR